MTTGDPGGDDSRDKRRGRTDVRRAALSASAFSNALYGLEAVETAETASEAWRAYAAFAESLGFDGVAFGLTFTGDDTNRGAVGFVSGEATAALASYVAADLQSNDPFVNKVLGGRQSFSLTRWFEEPHPTAGGMRVIENLADHGIGAAAILPIGDLRFGARGGLMLTRTAKRSRSDFDTAMAQWGPLLSLAAVEASTLWRKAMIGADSVRLSSSEMAIVVCLAAGLRAPEIAAKLGKSARTVTNQIDSARAKFGVRTNAALVAAAIEAGAILLGQDIANRATILQARNRWMK